MPGTDQQVVAMYELGQMSPEEISEQLQLELVAVRNCLMQHSRMFRESIKNTGAAIQQQQPEEVQDVTDQDFQLLRSAALSIALGDADDVGAATKARMIKFLWNEKKGRNNTKGNSSVKANIFVLNQSIIQAREAVSRALAQGSQGVVEMEKVV